MSISINLVHWNEFQRVGNLRVTEVCTESQGLKAVGTPETWATGLIPGCEAGQA